MTPVRLECAAPRSRVKHSTTEPLCSPLPLLLFCLFDLILYVPSTIFQLNRDGSSWVEPEPVIGALSINDYVAFHSLEKAKRSCAKIYIVCDH